MGDAPAARSDPTLISPEMMAEILSSGRSISPEEFERR